MSARKHSRGTRGPGRRGRFGGGRGPRAPRGGGGATPRKPCDMVVLAPAAVLSQLALVIALVWP